MGMNYCEFIEIKSGTYIQRILVSNPYFLGANLHCFREAVTKIYTRIHIY